MRKLLFTLLLLPLLSLFPAYAANRSLSDLRLSTGQILVLQEDGKFGGCSAVSVGPGQWLTEAHCNKGVVLLNANPTQLVKQDKGVDLMLLSGVVAPPVEIASAEPQLGDQVVLMGWPFGWEQTKPHLFFGRMAAENETVGVDDWPPHPMNFFHEGGGPGMSGGPIFNQSGQLVGITEAAGTYPSVSVGSPTLKIIRKFLGLKH